MGKLAPAAACSSPPFSREPRHFTHSFPSAQPRASKEADRISGSGKGNRLLETILFASGRLRNGRVTRVWSLRAGAGQGTFWERLLCFSEGRRQAFFPLTALQRDTLPRAAADGLLPRSRPGAKPTRRTPKTLASLAQGQPLTSPPCGLPSSAVWGKS